MDKQHYTFKIDKKCLVWIRETVYIKAEDYKTARAEMVERFKEDDYEIDDWEVNSDSDFDEIPYGSKVIYDGSPAHMTIWTECKDTKELYSNEIDENGQMYDNDTIITNEPINITRDKKIDLLLRTQEKFLGLR